MPPVVLFCLRVNHSHTSFQAIVECTFTSTTSKDLCFDYHVISANFLCDGLSFSRCLCDFTFGYSNAVLFGLVLFQIVGWIETYRWQQVCWKILMNREISYLLSNDRAVDRRVLYRIQFSSKLGVCRWTQLTLTPCKLPAKLRRAASLNIMLAIVVQNVWWMKDECFLFSQIRLTLRLELFRSQLGDQNTR